MKYLYIIFFSEFPQAINTSENNNETVIEASINANEIIISQSQFTSENMEFGKLEEQLFNHTIKTTGMIDVPPQNKAIISAFLGGYITKTPLLIGDKVKKGQVLVTLENPEFIQIQQEYLEISEQLNYLKAEFNRQKTLFDENITSQKNFLKAESAYKSNMAHFNGLRKKLVMLNINPTSVEQGRIASTINLYSPIEGYVTKVNISNGIYVSPSDIIMEIVDTNHIHLELSVFEKDILNVKKGQKIDFKIPEASNEIFEAEVHLAGTTIDKTSRIVLVHAHLNDESKANFIVGMYVEADIITDSKKSLALPKKAIIEIDENYFILVLMKKENDTFYFEKMKVNLGVQTETFVAILNPDDFLNEKILIEGAFMLGESGD